VSERRWTKEPNEEVRSAKTAWDWLQLLIVPIALAGIGYLFNHAENTRDRHREDARANQAQFIAAENRRDQVLQDYVSKIDDLVLARRLRQSTETSDLRSVARTLTLTALRRLDGKRKGEVVRFLADAELINGPGSPVVELGDADLRGVVLSDASLSETVFDSADLRRANFRGSALDSVQFKYARLERASFAGATLHGVAFTVAGLEHASFRDARMGNALSVQRGAPVPVVFQGACLSDADFDGSDARVARLGGAQGVRVSFDHARLTAASLDGAELGDSALGGAVTRALPKGWTKHGVPLTAHERRKLCALARGTG